VFIASRISGEPKETEEMEPRWFNIDDIPNEHMWSDCTFWLPTLLQGDFGKAEFEGVFFFKVSFERRSIMHLLAE
jgi:8-oxo-dGTP diphosphatase